MGKRNEIEECSEGIKERTEHWKRLNEHGGNDPFGTDGENMNLTRNHILYYKQRLRRNHEETGAPLPEEYYLPTPPEVDNNYMANLKQKERVERLIEKNRRLVTRRYRYNTEQLSLF